MSSPSSFLLQHFDRLAEAPGGLAKLRALILQFAVLGKTVESDADDTPIDTRILTSKKVPTNQAEGRTGGNLGPVTFEEMPYHLPPRWSWGRMFQLCEEGASIVYGILQPGPNIRPHGVPYVRPSEIENGKIILRDIRHTTKEIADKYERAAIRTGDVLLTIVGTIGATAVVPPELDGGNITQSSCRLRPDQRLVDPEFLLLALRSPCLRFQFDRFKLGTAVPRMNIAHVRALAVPLPPLAEQRRIVAKVEGLMGLCDALEAAQREREAVRTRLRTSALHRLASLDFDSTSTAFILQHLPRLTLEPEYLAHLRRSVLELAVAGKLTRQLKSDGTAQKLVERMDKARKALVKPPKLSALPEELPSEIPPSWTWQPLCALLSEPSQNGYSQSADESPDGIPLLRISAGTSRGDGDVEETDFKRTTLDAGTKAKFTLQVGDLLAVRFNGNLHFTGKVTIYRGKLGMLQIFPDKLIRLRVWNEFVVTEYVRLAMSAPVIRTAIESFCATSVGNMGISATDLVTVPIPLPPLAEQRRIVAKVDELMAVLAALEATLTTARSTSERLLVATIARLSAA